MRRLVLVGAGVLAASVLGACQVNQVDWNDFTYPTQFPFVGVHGPIPVPLHGRVGHITVRPGNVPTPVTVQLVKRADGEVTGDTNKDAVVWLSASYGAGSSDSELEVWTGTSGNAAPRLLGRMHAPLNAEVGLPPGNYLPDLYHMWLGGGDVWADAAYYVGNDPHSTPSHDKVVHWHWNGSRFTLV